MFNFTKDEDKDNLEIKLAKKRKSKADKAFLREYFSAIKEFVGTEEKDYQEKHDLKDDDIDYISEFLTTRLNILLKKNRVTDNLNPIEREELRALYSSAKWYVITTWSKTQELEVKKEIKKTNLRGIDTYKAPWRWSFYWP